MTYTEKNIYITNEDNNIIRVRRVLMYTEKNILLCIYRYIPQCGSNTACGR